MTRMRLFGLNNMCLILFVALLNVRRRIRLTILFIVRTMRRMLLLLVCLTWVNRMKMERLMWLLRMCVFGTACNGMLINRRMCLYERIGVICPLVTLMACVVCLLYRRIRLVTRLVDLLALRNKLCGICMVMSCRFDIMVTRRPLRKLVMKLRPRKVLLRTLLRSLVNAS